VRELKEDGAEGTCRTVLRYKLGARNGRCELIDQDAAFGGGRLSNLVVLQESKEGKMACYRTCENGRKMDE
jgi:hypothetical protein